MQATINNNQKATARRKLHIGLHFEFGLVPVYDAQSDRNADATSQLERAYHRQQLQERVSTERDSAYRRMRLG